MPGRSGEWRWRSGQASRVPGAVIDGSASAGSRGSRPAKRGRFSIQVTARRGDGRISAADIADIDTLALAPPEAAPTALRSAAEIIVLHDVEPHAAGWRRRDHGSAELGCPKAPGPESAFCNALRKPRRLRSAPGKLPSTSRLVEISVEIRRNGSHRRASLRDSTALPVRNFETSSFHSAKAMPPVPHRR